MSKKYTFTIGDRVIQFKVDEFGDEVDLDKLLKIDYSNIFAEVLTFPVVVNRLGLMAAEMDNMVQQSKLDLRIFEAKQKAMIRMDFEEQGVKRPTIDQIDDEFVSLKSYKKRAQEHYNVIKEKEFVYSAYLSAKDKSGKLDKLSMSLRIGDMDEQILQKQFNNLYFSIKKGHISDD